MHHYQLCSLILFALLPFAGCCNYPSEYTDLPHSCDEQLTYSAMESDTLFLDASMTSLEGQWLLSADGLICFIDKYSVGVKQYNLQGTFLGEHIESGRGPDEIYTNIWISTIDSESGSYVMIDNDSGIWSFDSSFECQYASQGPWFLLLDEDFDTQYEDYLYRNPNPEVPEMYEYNFKCRRITSNNGHIILPIITEYISYNGYEKKSQSKDCWKNAYVLISFDINDISNTRKLIGHYPPFYSTGNYPVFATYDFCIDEEDILISFAADPNIYVLDESGHPIRSFGSSGHDVSRKYPQTHSFVSYEDSFDEHRFNSGYYDRLFLNGNQLLRTYHTDSGDWRMQIYDDEILAGDLETGHRLDVFGFLDGWYYALASVNLEEEVFNIIRFKLR